MTARIVNAAGEGEIDRRSARANRSEAFALFAGLELAIWGGVGVGGALGWPFLVWLGNAGVGVCVVFMAVVSPRLHGDTAAAWGLPGPWGPWGPWRRLAWRATARAAASQPRASLAILLGVSATLIQGWPNLLARLGVRRHFASSFEWLTQTSGGAALGIAAALLVIGPLVLAVVRWENLRAATGPWLKLAVGLSLAVFALASLAEPAWAADPFDFLCPHPDRTSLIFYLLWGFVQQALFIGYFNVRLRRGMPAEGALGVPGRAQVALLGGLMFGLLHLPNPALVAATAVSGASFSWLFQADRTRNLFLAALVHALVGTLFAALVPMSTNAGPWR